jgi:hypothetical protein
MRQILPVGRTQLPVGQDAETSPGLIRQQNQWIQSLAPGLHRVCRIGAFSANEA